MAHPRWIAYADGERVYVTVPERSMHLTPEEAEQMADRLRDYAGWCRDEAARRLQRTIHEALHKPDRDFP